MGEAPPTVGGAIPGLVALGSLRKQAEEAVRSKPVSSSSPQPHQLLPLGSCSEFLYCPFFSDGLQYGSVSQMNPFLPNLLFGCGIS